MVIYYRDKFIKVFLMSLILYAAAFFFVLNLPWFIRNLEDFPFLPQSVYLLIPVILLASGLQFYSIYLLLKAKGYSGWLTILGLINIIGFAIVALLPDRKKFS